MDILFGKDLASSTQVVLLRQICLRLDRHFPNEEAQIKAEEAIQAAGELLLACSVQLDAIVPELGAAVRKIVEQLTGVTE